MKGRVTMIVHWLGWIGVILTVLSFGTWLLRKKGCREKKLLQQFRGKRHHQWGEGMLLVALIHGVLSILFFHHLCKKKVLTGILAFLAAFCLKKTAEKRKQLGGKWLRYHRIAAVALLPLLALHVLFSLFGGR